MHIEITTQCTDPSEIAEKVEAAIKQSVADWKAMVSSLVEPECKKWLCQYGDNASSNAISYSGNIPVIESVDIEVGSFDITLIPRVSALSATNYDFAIFHHNSDLPVSDVESTARYLGRCCKIVHSGLAPETKNYYWVRAVTEFGSSQLYPLSVMTAPLTITGDCEVKGSLQAKLIMDAKEFDISAEAKEVMEAKKAEIRGKAAPLVGGAVGEVSSFLSAYERPAIVITDRIGDAESTIEFATAADYKAWKELE